MTLRQQARIRELRAIVDRRQQENARLRRLNDHLISEVSRAYFAVAPVVAKLATIREKIL